MDDINNFKQLDINNKGIYINKPVEIDISNDEINEYYELDKSKNYPNKFKMSDKGLYSISKPELAKWIAKTIINNLGHSEQYIKENLSITDGTSGLGGDTIYFSKYFKIVNAVEIDNIHFNILKHNLQTILNIKNIKYYNHDYNTIYDKLINNVVYLDPPWGGKNISKIKDLMLNLGGVKIYVLIK